MEPPPVIQVLSKADYTEQHLVTLPHTQLASLPVSCVRVKSKLLSLSTNNLSYARMGHLFGWWDVHPLPSSTPGPFNDSSKYGRISAWGFGEVLESNIENLPKGTLLYGYLPIGTLPADLHLEVSKQMKNHFVETSAHRSHLFNIYNRYMILQNGRGEKDTETSESEAWDALMLVFFETSYNLDRFTFPFDGADVTPVHPLGDQNLPWLKSSASLANSIVFIFAASGKTALCFAKQLSLRPDKSSMRVIAVTSLDSRKYVLQTSLYEEALLYDEFQIASDVIKTAVTAGKCEKIVLCDFGARDNTAKEWLTSLRATPFCANKEVMWLGIAGGTKPLSHEEIVKSAGENAALGRIQVNASGMRDAAMSQVGEKRYFEGFLTDWNEVKKYAVPGLHFKYRDGMNEVGKAWERICDGNVKPDEGLLFEL